MMPEGSGEFELREIGIVAQKLLEAAGDCKAWLLTGDPGSGKTTLIRAVVTALGADPAVVSSPTFAILNDYNTAAGTVHHFDLYRVKNVSELYDLGMDEYLDSGEYCLVEWPERLGNLAPSRYFSVHLELTGAQKRKISFAQND